MADTNAAGEDNYGMSDDEDGASSNVGSTNCVSPPNALEIMGSEQIISRQTSRQETGDEGSTQPAASEGGCQSKASIPSGMPFLTWRRECDYHRGEYTRVRYQRQRLPTGRR